ncbi:MAG: tRNA uridine-5-carboxymethylaminomethyl(34) synthesis GTPase MnmE [Tannerellaceae bacterium]|jgi:tRNA modification GTPase|nr:tRNA uridine-5-carboxymethylaminomethyl(34) synthesis GTPase MnmE [Tannerellaceae bacterium]
MNDTICAISTAPGSGGIAVIRVSGPEAVAICNGMFFAKNKEKNLFTQPAYSICYGSIRRGEEYLDEALVSLFRAPHSYTGQDTVEITCHGSPYIQQQILQLLVEKGCRTALPGEFTQRAFLNGKMDLSQAEAVADLIASTSAGMHKLAMNQMRGSFGRELEKLREQLLNFTSLIELELDFGEEDVEFADRTHLKQLASDMACLIRKLADSFSVGNAIKNGIPVAIIGETNVGKSTLLNHLVGEERAIVSDIHGTTRDVIEDTINLSGITFRFIDTAGIRETTDTIESLGIERTFVKLQQASIVLWVIDLTGSPARLEALSEVIVPRLEGKKTILLFNKSDLLSQAELEASHQLLPDIVAHRLYISSKEREDIHLLKHHLIEIANIPTIHSADVIITNIRHYEALIHAHAALLRILEGLTQNISGDFLSQDIRECLYHLGEITGHISNTEILFNIFNRFCIGK